MAFNARIFGYAGIIQIHQILVKQYSADSVFLLDEPYIWSQVLAVPEDGSAISSSVYGGVPDKATMLRVEIPDAKQVRYEINPNGPVALNARIAGTLSPRLSGFNNFSWGPGYTISLCDAAAYL